MGAQATFSERLSWTWGLRCPVNGRRRRHGSRPHHSASCLVETGASPPSAKVNCLGHPALAAALAVGAAA
eukprot:scaffold46352_cov14-Tisochrysis_lutea.AAC.1